MDEFEEYAIQSEELSEGEQGQADDQNKDVAQVQVRFVSKNKALSALVPETPFSVPVHLARYGLSEILNHLISQGEPAEPRLVLVLLLDWEFRCFSTVVADHRRSASLFWSSRNPHPLPGPSTSW